MCFQGSANFGGWHAPALRVYLLIDLCQPIQMNSASSIQSLITRLNETPILEKEEAIHKRENFQNQIFGEVVTKGVSYGIASNGLKHLNQSEAQFRQTIKDTNNNLEWQISVFEESLDKWFAQGEHHAPYYTWRIAVILSKQKMKTEEKAFLEAYMRHFKGRRGGATDEKIEARASKIGVV